MCHPGKTCRLDVWNYVDSSGCLIYDRDVSGVGIGSGCCAELQLSAPGFGNGRLTVAEATVTPREEAREILVSGGLVEAIAGIAVAVLAILGLAGLLPRTLAAIAVLVLGVALLSLGGAAVAQFTRLARAPEGGRTAVAELGGGGIAIEILGGLVLIILGILVLLDVAPLVLLSVAIVVAGASLLLGGSILARLGLIETAAGGTAAGPVVRVGVLATAGVQVLVGGAALVLGILALLGIQAEILILVALLTFGVAILLSNVAVAGKLLTLMRA